MSDMKCPFCNKPLQPTHRSENEYWCENEDCTESSWKFGSILLWQELIRTRKALDVAVDALKLFYSGQYTSQPDAYGLKTDASCLAHTALAEITALEQKE